jgi:glycogen debranching enzyme
MGASINISSYELVPDAKTIRGLPTTLIDVPEVIALEKLDADGPYSEIIVPDTFPPGSIMLFTTRMEGLEPSLDSMCASGAEEAFKNLDLVDLNVLIHRADGEERDATGKPCPVMPTPLKFSYVCFGRREDRCVRYPWIWSTRLLWTGGMDDTIASHYQIQ